MGDMTHAHNENVPQFSTRWRRWLNQPLSEFSCLIGWLLSTVAFLVLNVALGGPTEGDAAESVYSTWAIAHGQLACSYPPPSNFRFPGIADPFAFISPLYPLLTGALTAILRIGHHVGFPSRTALGSHCSNAFVAMFRWSAAASSIVPTINLSYLVWPVLLTGTVIVLRSGGRGRRGWEPVTLLILAVSPPTVMCLVDFFHPQDVLALGLALIALGLTLRGRWEQSGVLVGLAFAAQPFALLIAAPLLVLAPTRKRVAYLAYATATVALIDLPLIILTSGRALKPSLFGSNLVAVGGPANFRSHGGTVLWETDVRGFPLLVLSRLMPILLAMALAWWASRRLSHRALEPANLVAIVATSLSLRLVFEENLFGYYFMALAVALVVLDALSGRIRGEVIAWIGLVTLAFNPVHWGLFSNWTPWGQQFFEWLPPTLMGCAALIILADALRHRFRWYISAWLILVALTCEPQWWGPSVGSHVLPNWAWQVILVPLGVILASGPLRSAVRVDPIMPILATAAGLESDGR